MAFYQFTFLWYDIFIATIIVVVVVFVTVCIIIFIILINIYALQQQEN